MARMQIAKKSIDTDAQTVTFDFSDGTQTVVAVADLPEDIKVQLMLHGASQKLGDSYSGSESIEQAKAAFAAVLKQLQDGEWTVRGTSSGGARVTVLAEAIQRVTGRDLSEVTEMLAGLSDEQKKALRAHPQIKAAQAQINAERAQERAAKAQAESSGDAPDIGALLAS